MEESGWFCEVYIFGVGVTVIWWRRLPSEDKEGNNKGP